MRVVINTHPDDSFDVITDEPCEILVVADHCPNDRIYRLTDAHTVSAKAVDAALQGGVVGHSGDERHAAIVNRILCAAAGKPYLQPVEDEEAKT